MGTRVKKYLRGLDAKRVISQKVKIEFLPVLCCHVVDSSTLSVVAQNALSAMCYAEPNYRICGKCIERYT